ncbi:long-chain fatty acid transport protein 3 isoform X1 [Pantherophis guttatus]|uniref:long-chain-fatty-acid--CoA ligase n=1 Tax=Pantherophis guttatus TaxID=94885 RepID=A0ABM3ZPF8_PANGU|nr:long-chain fatty acid transport protein 3 isoform X1 [Pantherophis guttatus]
MALGLAVLLLGLLALGLLGLLGLLGSPARADVAFVGRALALGGRLALLERGSVAQRWGRLAGASGVSGRPFLRFEGRSFSYGRAERESNRLGQALRAAGLGGRTAALLAGNEPFFVWAWIGLAKLGARPAFLGTALRPAALLHCLRACRARALLASHELFGAVEPILPSLKEMGIGVWVMGKGPYPPGVISLEDLLEEASEEPLPYELSTPRHLMDTCLYIFTSGTTGLPKAARVSHLKTILCLGFYKLVGACSSDVIYLTLPLYHMSGSLLGILGSFGLGATCVLKKKFSASQFWPDCRTHGVTVFQYIGELCRYLVNQPQSPADREHSLRMAVGSGMRPDVWREFLRRFGNIKVVETYGMTEGNATLFNYTSTVGAVGRGSWIYKCFSPFELVCFDAVQGGPLRDEATGRCQRVDIGEPGLLISPVTSRNPFLGYAGGRELSEAKLLRGVFANGDIYFNSGDLMVQDAKGFISFWDRTGDTYRWKGENVATTEVGETLNTLESLREVMVYGVTVPGHDGRAGMATLVLQPDAKFDGPQIYHHVAELLPPYAWPRFLRLQEQLEMTETFKQKRFRLVEEGFDPGRVSDPLFVLDITARTYIPLTPDVWTKIAVGELRL